MADKELPVIDEKRIQGVFDKLGVMEVELDPDPLIYGPRRLIEKVAKARGLLTVCERLFLQVSHDLQLYKRTHRAVQLDFDLQVQDLYANDPEVRAGRNVRDREALATMKLREEREQLISMEVAIQDLEMVMAVIKAKRADLRDIQNRIKDQIKLCQEEIGLGNNWRSKPPPGVDVPDLDAAPRVDKNALEQVQDLIADVEDAGEVHLAPGDSEWMDEGDEDFSVSGTGEIDLSGGGLTFSEDAPTATVGSSDIDPRIGIVHAVTDEDDDEEGDEEDDGVDETEVDDLLNTIAEVEAEGDDEDRPIESYPQVGFCSVCHKPQYMTPSGETCGEHGGAPTLDELPAEEPEPTEEPTEEPEPTPKGVEELDLGELFGDDGDGDKSVEKDMPAVTSDEEVDAMFNALSVEAAKSTKPKVNAPSADLADEDLDSLIDMFSAST